MLLLYLNAFFALFDVLRYGGLFGLIGLAIIAGGATAGFGIANEQKWAYGLGVTVAFLPALWRVTEFGLDRLFGFNLVSFAFEVLLVVLLLHPQSREYQRTWFS